MTTQNCWVGREGWPVILHQLTANCAAQLRVFELHRRRQRPGTSASGEGDGHWLSNSDTPQGAHSRVGRYACIGQLW